MSHLSALLSALSIALQLSAALTVQPPSSSDSLKDARLDLGYADLIDFASNLSYWLVPSVSKSPIRTVRTSANGAITDDSAKRTSEPISEVHPHNERSSSAVARPTDSFRLAARSHSKKKGVQTSLVAGWVLLHGIGNHTNVVQAPMLEKLTRAVRDSMADSLDVCRGAVSITEARSINVKLLEESLHVQSSSLLDITRGKLDWLFSRGRRSQSSQVNLTQVKVWFEVRIFEEMKASQDDVSARVDALQVYGRFADAGKTLARNFVRTNVDFGPIVVLDDLGYASRDQLMRPELTQDAAMDCTEEMLLRDARFFHQQVVAAALLVAAFTACAGSSVFGIKHVSNVPSRFNMLLRDRDNAWN